MWTINCKNKKQIGMDLSGNEFSYHALGATHVRGIRKSALGFTLIESVVAVSILVTALVGPMTLAARSIYIQRTAKNTLIAANLAQEGLELVRWYRDNNVLQAQRLVILGVSSNPPAQNWRSGLDNCVFAGPISAMPPSFPGCGIDEKMLKDDDSDPTNGFQSIALPVCDNTNEQCSLIFNDTKKQYELCTSAGCDKTSFSRKIKITSGSRPWPIHNGGATGPIIDPNEPDEVDVTVTVEWPEGDFILRGRLYAW